MVGGLKQPSRRCDGIKHTFDQRGSRLRSVLLSFLILCPRIRFVLNKTAAQKQVSPPLFWLFFNLQTNLKQPQFLREEN